MDENSRPKPGSALVTSTMLIQAASLLQGGYSHDYVEEFFDFCQFVEATVLHDTLFTLEGQVWPNQEQFKWLISTLQKQGILAPMGLPIDLHGTEQSMLRIVGSHALFESKPFHLAEFTPELFPNDTDGTNAGQDSRNTFLSALCHPQNGGALLSSPDVFSFFRSPLKLPLFLFGTGEALRGAYLLRTFAYAHAAWYNRIVFIPDFPRTPFLRSLSDLEHNSVVEQGYKILLDRIGPEVDRFIREQRPISLPVPPFAAILLDRCSAKEDVVCRLFELREEFTPLRSELTKMETVALKSTSLEEREDARRSTIDIFTSVAKKFGRTKKTTFASAVDFAGDALELAGDPLNPKSYKSSLLLKPVEWIRDWWLRRPLTQLFDVADEFQNIADYGSLAARIFGRPFPQDDLDSFSKAKELLNVLFRQG